MRRLGVAALVAVLLAVAAPTPAFVVPGLPKGELEPLAPGLPDPLDPPYLAPFDTTLPPLAAAPHPRLLFGRADLDWIRSRVADPSTVAGRAFAEIKAEVDAYQPPPPTPDPLRRFRREAVAHPAFVWLVTGDPAYLDTARATLRSQVAAAPNFGGPAVFDATEYYNQRAFILTWLAIAYDLLHDALPPDELLAAQAALLTLGSEHAAHSLTAWWGTLSTGSNFTANNGAAIGLAGLALAGDVPGPLPALWQARADQLVRSYAREGFDEAGAGHEGVLYGNFGLANASLFAAARMRAGGDNPLADPHVRRQQEWVAYELLPGGGAVNPLNDARYADLNLLHLAWAATFGADPRLAAWIFDEWDAGRGVVGIWIPTILWHRDPDPGFAPTDVLPLAKAFPSRGLVHVRSGWGPEDLMLSFEAHQGDFGEGVHRNQDVNSFTLYADGGRLVTDSGYANYDEKLVQGDFQGAESSTTQAHNYLVADGRSQDFLGKGDLRRFVTTAAVGDAGTIDVAVGDARPGYVVLQPERADRYLVHVRAEGDRPDYVVVLDSFRQGLGDHDHAWFLHTDRANTTEVLPSPTPEQARARTTTPDGDTLETTVVAASPLRAVVDTFEAADEQVGRHPRLVVTDRGAAHQSVAVLVPTKAGDEAPAVEQVPTLGSVAASIVHPDGVLDTALVRTGLSWGEARGVLTNGEAAFVRRGGDAHVGSTWSLVEGTRLEVDGLVVAEVAGGPTTVVAGPSRIAAEGEARALRVLAPRGATPEVRVNGAIVVAAACGAYLVWPASGC